MSQTFNIVMIASEMVPFCKTGGLADVIGALPKELARHGANVTVFIPYYRQVMEYAERNEGAIKPVENSNLPFFLPGYTGQAYLQVVEDPSGMKVYFVDYPSAYDREALYTEDGEDYPDNLTRFAIFTKAALEACKLLDLRPDIIHAHDWQGSLAPVYLKTHYGNDPFFKDTKSVLTIHNLGYQGRFPGDKYPALDLPWDYYNMNGLEFFGQVNVLKGGIEFADRITTVSPTYAEEIQTQEFGAGLDGVLRAHSSVLSGILNGVDYNEWDPQTDKYIKAQYSADNLEGKWVCRKDLIQQVGLAEGDGPVIGMISRLAEQKGFELVVDAMSRIIKLGCRMVILGTGEPRYHELLSKAAAKYPGKLAVKLAFSNELAHKIEAGSDIFLMPSKYEPCGLNQMYSLRYGTVPIVSSTGGLKDTVVNVSPARLKKGQATGFVIKAFSANSMFNTVKSAVKLFNDEPAEWEKLVIAGMRQDFSWPSQAKEYMKLFESLASEVEAVVQ